MPDSRTPKTPDDRATKCHTEDKYGGEAYGLLQSIFYGEEDDPYSENARYICIHKTESKL